MVLYIGYSAALRDSAGNGRAACVGWAQWVTTVTSPGRRWAGPRAGALTPLLEAPAT
jgi:hypothetical protein